MKSPKVLIKEEELKEKIKEVAKKINADYQGRELTIVCVLKGALMFCTELVKYLEIPVRIEFVRLSSYGSEQKSSGVVNALDLTLPSLKERDVLIVEDIIDTGLTIQFLKDYIMTKLNPKSLKVAAMADKKIARTNDLYPDYYAFDIDEIGRASCRERV